MFGKRKSKFNVRGIFTQRNIFAVILVCAYVIVLGTIALPANNANATIPKLINFQGKLTQVSDGSNMANGTYAFEFKIYDALTSGSLLWTETYDQPSGACGKLTVTNGVFNAKLGSCNALTSVDFTGGSLYMTVNFAPTGTSYDGEMSPRKQLVSSAYAFVANGVSGDGAVNTVNSSATALSVAKAGSNYALQVDTSAGSAATGLKVTSAAAASGLALTTISSGTNENLTIDAKGSGTVSINGSATGDVLLAGGSGSTGCTVTNSTGAFACTAGGSFTTLGLTGAVTGAASYNGLVVTANTGVITSGTWQGGVIGGTYGGTGVNNGASTITLGGNLVTSGAFSTTLTSTGTTTVTLPTSGTLATLAGSEVLTNKTIGNTNTVTLKDTNLTVQDDGDVTKQLNFQLSGITTGTTRTLTIPDASGTICLTGGTCVASAVSWSSITAPTGNLSLAHGANTTSFTYNSLTTANALSLSSSSLSSGELLDLSVTGTAGLTNQKGINVSLSGANGTGAQTTYGGYFSNIHTGTSNNVGLYATASGGSNNYAGIFDQGNVGIGTTAPAIKLEVLDASNPQLRLTQAAGSAYVDLQADSSGYLNIRPSGNQTNIGASGAGTGSDLFVYSYTAGSGITLQPATAASAGININNSSAVNKLSIGVANTSNNFITGSAAGDTTFRANNQSILFSTNNGTNSLLNLNSSGNVGIGTNSPAEKFSVTGGNILQTVSTNPVIKGTVIDATNLSAPKAIYVSGRYAYIANLGGFRFSVVDVANPAAPTVVSSLNDSTNLAGVYAVHVAGKYAYVGVDDGGSNHRVTIVDVSNPSSLSVVGSVNDGTNLVNITSIYVSGRYAYVATGNNQITVVDVSNPTAPTVLGNYFSNTNLGGAQNVYLVGKYLYVAVNGNSRITVVDVSNPNSPSLAGTLQDTTNLNNAYGIYVSGKYAYVTASAGNRLTVVDISNPASPVVVGNVNDATNLNDPRWLYVSGRYAYVVSYTGKRITVVDITTPASPTVVGSLNDTTNFSDLTGIYVSGKYAYVTNTGTNRRLAIVDINGIDSPSANIGNLSSSDITVLENADIGNNLYVRNGLNVGPGGIQGNGDLVMQGNISSVIQSTTALTIGRTTTNPAFQVDTNTANSATGLKVTSAAATGGLALTVISSGTDENLTLDAKGAGTISIGATSTGNVLLAGGSGATGCTVTNSTGAFACTGAITGSGLSGTNTGDVTLAAFGSTPNANGASLSGQVLNLQPADGSNGGGVSTTTQTFAGNKTFNNGITIATGQAVTGAGSLTVTSTAADLTLSTTTSGNIAVTPASTGSLQVTSGVTTGTGTSSAISLVANSLTTSGVGLNISSSGAGMTTGSLLRVTSSTTGAVATNGIISFVASGAYTSSSSMGFVTVKADSTSTGVVQRISGAGLTTGTILHLNGGTGMTTGSFINTAGSLYVPAAGQVGSMFNLGTTTASTNTTGTATFNGINLTLNDSSAGAGGTQELYGIHLQDLGGSPGAGTQNHYGIRVGNYGLASSELAYGIYVDPQSGSTANYAAYFGSNVGIGDSTPLALFTVGTSDAFQVDSTGQITSSTLTSGATQCLQATSAGVIQGAAAPCGSGSGTRWDQITAPTAPLSLTMPAGDETTFTVQSTTQTGFTWQSSTLTSGVLGKYSLSGTSAIATPASSGSALTVASTATGWTAATQTLGAFVSSGANTNTGVTIRGLSSSVTNTGTTSTNVGLYATASGGTNNYAAIFDQGSVGIGTTAPTYKLDILDSLSSGNVMVHVKNSSAAAGFNAAGFVAENSSSTGTLFKVGAAYTGFKTIQASDLGFFNQTLGNISILNDYASGNINFAAGGSSTAQLTVTTGGSFVQTQTAGSLSMKGVVTDATNLNNAFEAYVSGKYAYVAANIGTRLTVVDVSNPASPTVVGNVSDATNLNGARGVYVSGKYAYVTAQSGNRLTVVDVSNPVSPTVVGNVNDATNLSSPIGIYVSGKYAYVASAGGNRLTVVDISNPVSPTVVGNVNDATNLNTAAFVYVSGKYAYVTANAGTRLTIVDISNPTSPTVVGNINDATNLNTPYHVYVSGKYAYVAVHGGNRLTIVDISNPASPTVVGNVNDATNLAGAQGVSVAGKYAYVTSTGGSRLTVVDISNPASPTVVGNLNDATNLNTPRSVQVLGKYAYIANSGSNDLAIVDIAGIDAPTANIGSLSSNNIAVSENLDVANNIYARNGLNVGVGGILSGGPVTIQGSNTTQTTTQSLEALVGNSITTGTGLYVTTSALTSGNSIQVVGSGATMTTGGELIDLSLGANTVGAGMTITSTGAYTGVGAADGLINVTANSLTSGYAIQVPHTTSVISTTGSLLRLSSTSADTGTAGTLLSLSSTGSTAGTIAMITNNTASFTGTSFSVSNTGITSGIGIAITGGSSLGSTGKLLNVDMGAAAVGAGVNIVTTGAYTGAGMLQLTANTATTGTLGLITSSSLTTGNLLSLTSNGTAAGASQTGLNISLQGTNSTSSITTYGAQISNTHAGTTSTNIGLYATATGGTTNNFAARFDGNVLQNPTSTMLIKGSINDATNLNGPTSVYVSGKYAYVAVNTGNRLTIVDITNPSSPVVVGNVNDTTNLNNPQSVYVSGKYAYVTASTGNRLTIVDISNPTAPAVVGNVNDATNLNSPQGLYVSGKYAYVAVATGNRLTVVDISNPTAPAVVGNVNDATNLNNAQYVYVSGKYAYVTAFLGTRLTIVDISNPTAPAVVGNVSDATNLNGPLGLYVSGKYAYVVAANRLTVIDVSTPASPAVVGNANDSTNLGGGKSVYVSGKYAYVSVNSNSRLTIVDISTPASPAVIGTINDSTNLNNANSVYISGKYAYVVANAGNRLTIVDITGIDAPTASIGNLSSSDISVTENADIGNNLYVRNGLNVGPGGIQAAGGNISLQNTVLGSGANAIAGIFTDLTLSNSTTGGFQYGNRSINRVTGANVGTEVGEFIRMIDNTTLDSSGGNIHTVRGLEVQAYSGTNVNGVNTGIATFGYTFGIQATTTAQAAAQAAPAAIFADLDNGTDSTTKSRGNAIRAYTDNATSATLVQFYQETSAYTGTGLQMNFGNNSGSFVGNFADYQYQGTSKYTMAYSSSTSKTTETFGATGSTSDYASATNGNTYIAKIPQKATTGTCASAAAEGLIYQNTGGTQVGHLCIDGPTSGTPNKLRFYAEQFNATSTDVAENYSDANNDLAAGDVVMLDSTVKYGITKAAGISNPNVIGIVSTSPGMLLTGIAESNHATELVHPKAVALAGRVPVKVLNENGEIKAGDFLTTSSTPGYAMRATKAGPVIGQALEDFNSIAGTIDVFVKASNYNGAKIEDEMPGLAFNFGTDHASVTAAAQNSEAILAHLLEQLPQLDSAHLSEVQTDVVIARGELITPTVTSHTLRTDLLSAATSEGGLTVASETVFNGGLKVDSIGSIGTLISFNSDVEFFGIPYFTADTAGFAVVKTGVQSVDVTFTHEYLAQPIVSATVSFEQDADQSGLNEEQRAALKDSAITDAQNYLANPVSYVITNKSKYGFTIVLNKPADRDIKLSWTALAVRNATTFMSLDAPANSPDSGSVAGDSTPPPTDGNGTDTPPADEGSGSGDNGQTPNP